MLSIPPGWYLLKPDDVAVHYWNGSEFTSDIAPVGHGRYSVLTARAFRRWSRADRKARRLARKFPPEKHVAERVIPEGYLTN